MEVADYGQHTDMQGEANFGPTVEEADSSLTVGFPGYTVVVAEIFGKTTQTTDFACSLGPKSVYYYFVPHFQLIILSHQQCH
ncbi:pinin-like [Pyrus ussuriensis x Pyrus communis]|uniref:Pinin-like n=1 Tax=Pyrus ussuriensis x Pyrus communis TaxID=2448454 RepID=A0A5N5HFW7_9ROSA|nr:pinin-like [Pyrus ussuriensis x Pyrus communis]